MHKIQFQTLNFGLHSTVIPERREAVPTYDLSCYLERVSRPQSRERDPGRVPQVPRVRRQSRHLQGPGS